MGIVSERTGLASRGPFLEIPLFSAQPERGPQARTSQAYTGGTERGSRPTRGRTRVRRGSTPAKFRRVDRHQRR